MVDKPQTARRGWLKNNNPPGDLSKAKQCGARTRKGTACKGPAMPNGRCRMHGGPSTGPRTPEGREGIRISRTKHGRYSQQAIERRQAATRERRAIRETLKVLSGLLRGAST